jgi:hypothetical protein
VHGGGPRRRWTGPSAWLRLAQIATLIIGVNLITDNPSSWESAVGGMMLGGFVALIDR